MPYKIYTYRDPYKLNQTDFWPEIADLPHFCVSRTLVNGLKNVMSESIRGLLCPLDDFVNKVYGGWTKDIQRRIQQRTVLSRVFREALDNGEIDKPFHMALTQNQTRFLDAIRLFIALGMSPEELDGQTGNREQRFFVAVLRKVWTAAEFQFPATPGADSLKEGIADLALHELEEHKARKQEQPSDSSWYERAVHTMRAGTYRAIVVHGVHQFTPEQIRLILDMELLGFTIIFLFNYQPEYSEIYSSWNFIYQCFETPFHQDENIQTYETGSLETPSHALACAMGDLCEGGFRASDTVSCQRRRLYQSLKLIEFANMTEYAHHVSSHFDRAIQKHRDAQSVPERGRDAQNRAAVLRVMDEQIYTANREIHTLLKIYYPEYAKERPFLAYPIGQFFSAIYRLWDEKKGEIRLDVAALKECLSSRVLRAAHGHEEELLRTFYYLEGLFENLPYFRDFKRQIDTIYQERYNEVSTTVNGSPIYPLKVLSIYNPYKVSKKNVRDLLSAIEEINAIAGFLFASGNAENGYIHFGKHFKNLEDFLKQRDFTLMGEEERALIDALKQRLDEVRPERSKFSGTFQDLRKGINYYLQQKEREDPEWIVKNFEQIDGDILQSRSQALRGQRKTYHFACLSDYDMNSRTDDLLPWPLTDSFILRAYSQEGLAYRIYQASISERSAFLRYALFYGLFFNRCETRLSYVKQYDDRVMEPYSLLTLLGFRKPYLTGIFEQHENTDDVSVNIGRRTSETVRYDRYEMADMFLCPYRFFLDYVIRREPVMCEEFLYEKYYENALIENVWKQIAGWPSEQALNFLNGAIPSESAKLRPYFFFWNNAEISDLERRAGNYLAKRVISDKKTVPVFDASHMDIRKLFGKAWFSIPTGGAPQNPYPAFQNLTEYEKGKVIYSLHKVPGERNPRSIELAQAVSDYLHKDTERDAVPSEWCGYCANRGVCLAPFAIDKPTDRPRRLS